MQFSKAQVSSDVRDDAPAGVSAARGSDAKGVRWGDEEQSGWFSLLSRPVNVPDGLTLKTLSDAGAYILDLPDHVKRQAFWERAADRLLDAAAGIGSIADATAQIERALDLTLVKQSRPTQGNQSAKASIALVRSVKERFLALGLFSRKQESRTINSDCDDKTKKTFHTLTAANASIRRLFKSRPSIGLVRYSAVRGEIARRLQRFKKVAGSLLKLPDGTGEAFFDAQATRRGLYCGLASALMVGALLVLLQPSTASPVLTLILYAVTSVLVLLSLSAMLIISLTE